MWDLSQGLAHGEDPSRLIYLSCEPRLAECLLLAGAGRGAGDTAANLASTTPAPSGRGI